MRYYAIFEELSDKEKKNLVGYINREIGKGDDYLPLSEIILIFRYFLSFVWKHYLIKGGVFDIKDFVIELVLKQRTPKQCERMYLNPYNKKLIDKTGFCVPMLRLKAYIFPAKTFKKSITYRTYEIERNARKFRINSCKETYVDFMMEINYYKQVVNAIINNEEDPRIKYRVV